MVRGKWIPEFDLELEALHENCIAEEHSFYPTQKQIQTLASLMGSGLTNKKRENRLSVLRLLVGKAVLQRTGYSIQSTKNIPGEIASILIDLLKENESWELSGYGRELLFLAEERVEARVVSHKN
jgi:hypothetical protein